MRNIKSLVLVLLVAHVTCAQESLSMEGKTLTYQCFFVDPHGDTLTREQISLTFSDEPWKVQKTQRTLLISYNPDSAGISNFVHPFKKVREKHQKFEQKKKDGKKGWENWTWLEKESTTGYILNDSIFWIHPPRANQYIYMQLSGMPGVELGKLEAGAQWDSKLIIMMGWHDFKGTLVSTYQVLKKISYKQERIIANGWSIKVNHTHNTLGSYESLIVFDETEYGFLSMDHRYPEGYQIIMNLIAVNQ